MSAILLMDNATDTVDPPLLIGPYSTRACIAIRMGAQGDTGWAVPARGNVRSGGMKTGPRRSCTGRSHKYGGQFYVMIGHGT